VRSGLEHPNSGDAQRVSEALQAGVMGRYPGWASQREFTLGGKAIKTIERALREVVTSGADPACALAPRRGR